MAWLESVSNFIALFVCLAVLAVVFASSRREPGVTMIWQSRVIPLLMLAAAGFWAVSGHAAIGPAHEIMILAARLMFLVATVLVWPLLRDYAAYADQICCPRTQCRLDVAMAAAAESREWLRLAEKIARVGHWRYAVADGRLVWSDEVYTILGLDAGGSAPELEVFFGLIAPADRARATADFHAAVNAASPFEFTVQTLKAGQPGAFVTARGIPEFDEAGEVTALFGVLEDITARKQIEDDLKAARLASEVALERLSRQDALTSLANRRHFDEAVTQEFRRAARETQPVGLIMVDLDHFAAFQSRYGETAGDACLQSVAAAIAAIPRRPADLVARYGGEEIAVLLPNTDLIGTDIMAALIMQAVRDLAIPHAEAPQAIVTINCGTAVFEPHRDPVMAPNLLERADQALSAAKRGLRQRPALEAMAA